LTHATGWEKYKGKNKADGDGMYDASLGLVVAWNGIHENKELQESSQNPVPGPSTIPRHLPVLSADANAADSSHLDILLGDFPADSKTVNHLPTPQDPRPPPLPLLETPEETMSRYVAQVLEIIPDVDPEHCATLVADHFPSLQEATVERVLHLLFEDVSYPKAKKLDKGKRKASSSGENDRPKKKAKKDDAPMWLDLDRPYVGGSSYCALALVCVQISQCTRLSSDGRILISESTSKRLPAYTQSISPGTANASQRIIRAYVLFSA
jgi:TRIAD3 protein (E3 ubiquitin-protein ligase RNF216)